MDIRRLSLWEGRYATYMSNDIFSSLIEDQGEVLLELTSRTLSGARINALALPYFRGTGAGVISDDNSEWWQSSEALYQAGGGYFTFPSASSEHINSINTYWTLRRYGTEEEYGGVWRLSEMKSREEGNRYKLEKIDMLLPGHPALYTAIRITNTGSDTLLGSASWHSMIASPLLETGSLISSNARYWTAYALSRRESGVNRFLPGMVFDELKHAPLVRGGNADAGFVPPPTGTYDYLIGKIQLSDDDLFAVNERKLLLLSLTYRLCSVFSRQFFAKDSANARRTEIFLRLIRLIDRNYMAERGVAFYADKLCLSAKYLSELSKSVCGYTVQELVFKAITRKAMSLLDSTNKTVAEISDEFHFPNPSSFGTFFRKQTGLSPQKYRDRL